MPWYDMFKCFVEFIIMHFFFADVVQIPKTNENFRLLYDTKGRFRLHSIRDEEAKVCSSSCVKCETLLICFARTLGWT